MKKLNITREAFEKSKHFQRKYGKLEYVSESGKLYKTDKGHVIKFVKESDESGSSPWFDDRGDMLKTLPGDCILACSGQGRVDDDVAFWVKELDFTNGLPRERTINYLREYGAWDDEELNEMTEMSLAEKVLWIFCNDLKEQAYDMVGEDEELAEKLGDDPSAWGDREWEQFQNEYGFCTLSN